MPRSLRRTHTFADVRRASHDEIYLALSQSGFNLPGPVNAHAMNNAVEAQAPPPSPNNSPMHVPMELDTNVFVVGAALPPTPTPTKTGKKLRAHSTLPYDRDLVSAFRRNGSQKKKAFKVSFKAHLDTIEEENEAPKPCASAPVRRGGSFTELFRNMNISR